MQTNTHFADQERKCADLLQEAAEVIQTATVAARELTADEDLHVLELVKQAHVIEEELLR